MTGPVAPDWQRVQPAPTPDDPFPYKTVAEANQAARKAYLAGTPWIWRGEPVREISEPDFRHLLSMKAAGMLVRTDARQAEALTRDERELLARYRLLRKTGKVGIILVQWTGSHTQICQTTTPELVGA